MCQNYESIWLTDCSQFVDAVKLGIGGFSMGAAAALHSAACYAHGKFSSGTPYPITLSAVISLSGWLPCSRSVCQSVICHRTRHFLLLIPKQTLMIFGEFRTLRGKMEGPHMAARRPASLPILLSHGRGNKQTYRLAADSELYYMVSLNYV